MLGDPTWGGVRGDRLAPTTCACAHAATACSWWFGNWDGIWKRTAKARYCRARADQWRLTRCLLDPHTAIVFYQHLVAHLNFLNHLTSTQELQRRRGRRWIAVPAFSLSDLAAPSGVRLNAWKSIKIMRTYEQIRHQSIPSTKCQRVWKNRDNFIAYRIIQYIEINKETTGHWELLKFQMQVILQFFRWRVATAESNIWIESVVCNVNMKLHHQRAISTTLENVCNMEYCRLKRSAIPDT